MNSISIDKNFEREKNLKALGITLVICTILLLLFFLVKWTSPTIPPPLADEGIEVNLGNSETGLGNIEPQAPGEPAQEQNNSTPPTAAQTTTPTETMDEKGDEAINATPKPITPKPIIKPVVPVVKAPIKPIINPTPKAPTPKAVFAGGTKNNTGGNKNDSYNGIKNQGIAGGNGNQGVPNGNPNSDTYGPQSGSGGVKIKSGLTGRSVAIMPKFQDEFNENAKVAVDVTVDATGKVLSATVNPRGTTTTNQSIRQIATKKAFQVKFTAGAEEQTGTIVFDFKVTN